MKFIYSATVEIEAESEEDAQVELLTLMNRHEIDWWKEQNED